MNTFNSLLLGVGLIGLTLFSGCSSELRRDSANGYRIRSDEVYWSKLKIDGVEADSFEIATVDGEDVPWASDATRVYYRNLVVEGADPNSFKVLDQDWACDKQFLFRGRTMNRQVGSLIVVGTERGLRVDRQDGFDSATLRIAHRTRHETWFADQDHVYFDSSGSLFSFEYVIDSADPETFHRDPESSYWMDKNFVFGFGTMRIGDKVDGEAVYANPNAWRSLPMENGEASKYFTDDRFIWRNGRILKGANPQTFRALSNYEATDGNHVWRGSKRLEAD